MSDYEGTKEEKELDLTSPDVVTKYKTTAEIVNKAQQLLVSEYNNVYKNVKKKIERGIIFPTCVSVNNAVCHFSPLASDDSVVEAGDIVKIDLGLDGFIDVVAHTHVVQEGPVTGRAADVIAAANTAAEVALRVTSPS